MNGPHYDRPRQERRMSREVTAFLLCTSLIWISVTGCREGSREPPPPKWDLAEFRSFSEEGTCCLEEASVLIGLMAAGEMAIEGGSLKLAFGCRNVGDFTETGTIIELKLRDRTGATESFSNAVTNAFDDCDQALISGAAAIVAALKKPAAVWNVTTMSDKDLCSMLDSTPDIPPKAVLMRGVEEAAQRRLNSCVETIAKLAQRNDPDLAVRSAAALGRIGDKRAIMTLGRLTLSPIPELPWAAAHAIADIGGPEAAKALDIVAGQSKTTTLATEAAELAEKLRSGQ